MKKRKWVLFLFIFIVAALMIVLQGWRIFKANERLEYYIQNQLRPVLGTRFDISKVHVGFGNIHIQGVFLPLEKNNIDIEIYDLVLGYNVLNLIIPGFKSSELSNNIQFLNPVVTFHQAPDVNKRIAGAPPDSLISMQEIFLNFKPIRHLNRVTIKEGVIQWSRGDTILVPVIQNLNGAIYRENQSDLVLRGKGSLFHSKAENILAEGRVDLQTGRFQKAGFTVHDYNLNNEIGLLDPEKLELNSGLLDADLVWLPKNNPRDESLSGSFSIRGGEVQLYSPELHIQDVNTSGEIRGTDIYLQSEQLINDAVCNVKGAVYQITDPVFDLDVSVKECNLRNFKSLIPEDVRSKVDGLYAAEFELTGFYHEISLDGVLQADECMINGIELSQFSADTRYKNKELTILSSTAFWQTLKINMNGVLDFKNNRPKLSGSLESSGDISPIVNTVLADSIRALNTLVSAEISGTVKNPLVLGTIGCSLVSQNNDSVFYHSAFSFYNQKARLNSLNNKETLNVQAMLDLTGALPELTFRGDSVASALFAVLNLPENHMLRNNYDFSLELAGNPEQFTLKTDMIQLNKSRFLSLYLDATKKSGVQWIGKGHLSLYPEKTDPLTAEYAVERTDSELHLTQLSIENQLFSKITIDLKDSLALNGTLKTYGLDIQRLFRNMPSGLSGNADSDFIFSGTLLKPVAEGSIALKKLFFNDKGPYKSSLEFIWGTESLDIENFMLNTETSTLLIAGGTFSQKFTDFDLWLKGAGFDLEHLWFSPNKDDFPVSGKTFVDLAVSGTQSRPKIKGRVGLKDGDIYGIPFDEFEIKLGDSFQSGQGVLVDSFRLSRFDEYQILGRGFYPFAVSDSMQFEMTGDGNLLVLLSDISDFVQSPFADCSLNFSLSGTPQSPMVEHAEIKLKNGKANFKNVIPPVTDISSQISFESENNYVDLQYLKGKMGNSPFLIQNTPVSRITSEREIENMTIPGPDLNLGVLIVESPQEPVPLNIQGLMEPGDFGQLRFAGFNPDEKMYIAAYDDGYILRGMIFLSHSQIMLPFYERENSNRRRGVNQFLENLFWDVKVIPMENNWFTRNYPGAIDEVYVNIMLDENFGGLEFTGRIADETFRINGELRSTSGFVEYLDMSFMVEQFGVQFDRSSMIPVTYGRAKTTVTDSLGITSNIYLTLQTVDTTVTQDAFDELARQESSRGRFNKIRFKLTSDNPNIGTSEAQIMSSLGYSASNLQNSALSALGYSTDNILFRPLFRPLERELEKTLGLDYVRFSSQLTRNILNYNLNNNVVLNDRLLLLESTRVIVGKYLANRFFLQYTGQIESGIGYRYREKDLGLHHTLGLEFRLSPQVLLELEYDYDSLMLYNRQDARIVLRHWFPF